MKKKKRRNFRIQKIKNLKINKLPKNNILKPIVQNPTKMYNFKIRLGRGFSVDELKNSMIPKNIASSIGISLDKRRRGNSLRQPSNIKRLNSYFEKIRSKRPNPGLSVLGRSIEPKLGTRVRLPGTRVRNP